MNIVESKYNYYKFLDLKAKSISEKLKTKSASIELLNLIIELYKSAKVELNFTNADEFESAYHSPITSEFEFAISRILFHYSKVNNLGWKVLLRKQIAKTAPDIRIEKGNKTLAVIEIKVKAGWIQPFLSQDRFDNDSLKYKNKKSKSNPVDLVEKLKNQLLKYKNVFDLEVENIFFLLPTLDNVHRNHYKKELLDYVEYFEKTSGLPADNLILLSKNIKLNLSEPGNNPSLEPTTSFERMLNTIKYL